MRKLSVAIVSKADKTGGGASRVADDLCDLLRAEGHQADHWLGTYDENKPYLKMLHSSVKPVKLGIRIADRLARYAGFPDILPFEYFMMKYGDQLDKYDIVHFHDLSSMISPLTVYWIARKKPVVWTFHDCSPFTAGCLYPFDCNQFKTVCTDCPQKNIWPIDSKLLSATKLYNLKRYIHSKNIINCITPSKWMSDMAMSSGLFQNAPEIVSNGVDTDTFKPFDRERKNSFRKAFGIPEDRPVILLSAAAVHDERKGIKYALQALKEIKHRKPFILVIGRIDYATEKELRDFDYFSTGYIFNDKLKAKFFAAADCFLFCSLSDNQPLIVLEAMACGLATVGFATGGIPEIVEQDKTGFLVKMKDQQALAKALEYAMSDDNLVNWGKQARKKAETEFTMNLFFKHHLDLYYKLLPKGNAV